MLTTNIRIVTSRFQLRPLDLEDVTDRYVGWMKNEATRGYIATASSSVDINSIQQYVYERSNREDIIFLGIFEKNSKLHIGNIKFEPVDSRSGFAVMGILVGEPEWRGKGVAVEVLRATAVWLRQYRNIRKIVLGVSCTNTQAIRAYRKAGFVEQSTELIPAVSPSSVTMVWEL